MPRKVPSAPHLAPRVLPRAALVLAELEKLRPGTTACPGRVARRLGTTLRELRPTILALQESGHLRITQKGRPADPATLKGPFRIAPSS